jgi:16S rRNA (guanine527-N7)-methyltransferase
MNKIVEILNKHTKELKTKLDETQMSLLVEFNEFLQKENSKYNLTAITEPEEVAIRHFLDSLYLAELDSFQAATNVIDIGSGAGFPGIPLAIAYSKKEFLLVDSLRKRVDFLNELIDKLDLTNVKAVHKRAEEIAKEEDYREKFEFVTARAVAQLNVLAEYCLPLVKKTGVFVAMKLLNNDTEVNEAKKAIDILGGRIRDSLIYHLPKDKDYELIEIKKIRNTPKKYPRRPGMPKKRPLI